MRAAGKIFIILGIMAAIGAILSEGQVIGGLVALLLLGGIGSLLLYAAGAKNRKYRRLGEQTNTYYKQIRAQPQISPRPWLLQSAASIATKPGHRDEPQGFSGQSSNSAKPVLLQSFLHTAVTNVLAGFAQPQKEQLAQAQPPAATRSQSLEAGLFDE